MKKIIVALILLPFIVSFNYMYEDSLVCDNSAHEGLTLFIYESEKRGLNLRDDIFSKLDSIVFKEDLPSDILGQYIPGKRTIELNNCILLDKFITNVVVIHELTHVFIGNIHMTEPGHIMSSKSDNSFFLFFDENVWDSEMDIIFNKIKQIRETK